MVNWRRAKRNLIHFQLFRWLIIYCWERLRVTHVWVKHQSECIREHFTQRCSSLSILCKNDGTWVESELSNSTYEHLEHSSDALLFPFCAKYCDRLQSYTKIGSRCLHWRSSDASVYVKAWDKNEDWWRVFWTSMRSSITGTVLVGIIYMFK